nr:MAG TPA: hypothetical protein [Caudoviricetes sp.]
MLSLRGLSARSCIAALPAVLKRDEHAEAYRVYVTDALKIICENTARYAGGSCIEMRYIDLINPKPEDTRTGDDVIEHMKLKLRTIGGE